MADSAEKDVTRWEWGVQWDDGVIAYPTEEIARHEQAFPTRPDRVNPSLVRRRIYVCDWQEVRVLPPAVTGGEDRG